MRPSSTRSSPTSNRGTSWTGTAPRGKVQTVVFLSLPTTNEVASFFFCRELFTYISTELRELDPEELNAFLDSFTKHILDLVKSSDTSSKLGGILAIVALINAEACNTGDRISRFNNYLRNNCLAGQGAVYSSSDYTDLKTVVDAAIIELASKAIARLFQGWFQQVAYQCSFKIIVDLQL